MAGSSGGCHWAAKPHRLLSVCRRRLRKNACPICRRARVQGENLRALREREAIGQRQREGRRAEPHARRTSSGLPRDDAAYAWYFAYVRSNLSAFITFVHAATKSSTNFWLASALP